HLLSQGIEGIPERNTAVFDVLQDHGIVQPTPDGKAIWRVTVTSGSGWSHSFTVLKLAPALIWDHENRPPFFVGTVRVENDRTSNDKEPYSVSTDANTSAKVIDIRAASASPLPEPQDTVADPVNDLLDMLETAPAPRPMPMPSTNAREPHSLGDAEPISTASESTNVAALAETDIGIADPSGEHFLNWVRRGIQSRKLIINDAKALVHTVAGTAYLVSPGIFQRYGQEHPKIVPLAKQAELPDWRWAQQYFERLKVHKKRANGLNIWTCEVTGPRKSRRLHGYLLADPDRVFKERPIDNPYLKLIDDN